MVAETSFIAQGARWMRRRGLLWQRLLPCFILLPILGLCIWAARSYRPPAPARSAADLEQLLPPLDS